jgi:hypothetical protein
MIAGRKGDTNMETQITYTLVEHVNTGDIWAVKERGEIVLAVRKCKPGEVPAQDALSGLTYDVGDDLCSFLNDVIYNWRKVA